MAPRGCGLAVLNCKRQGQQQDARIAIQVRDISGLTMKRFTRISASDWDEIDMKKFMPSQYPVRRLCMKQES